MAKDNVLLVHFQIAKMAVDEAMKAYTKAIEKIEKIDVFERQVRIISDCCGAYPYPNAKTGAGTCDACGEVCGLDARVF